jgi:hypothetical protein
MRTPRQSHRRERPPRSFCSRLMPRSLVGMGQVLHGSDYPCLRRDLAVGCHHEVEKDEELNPEEARVALTDNALQLFPRLRQQA